MIICQLYVQALCGFYNRDVVVICADEKTGYADSGNAATPPSRCNLASQKNANTSTSAMGCARIALVLWWPTGQLVWNLGQTRTSADWAAPFGQRRPSNCLPCSVTIGVIDNLNTHWSLDVCRLVAQCVRSYCPKALRRGVPAARSERSDPSACLPLYAQAWIMAQSKSSCGLAFWPVGSQTR